MKGGYRVIIEDGLVAFVPRSKARGALAAGDRCRARFLEFPERGNGAVVEIVDFRMGDAEPSPAKRSQGNR